MLRTLPVLALLACKPEATPTDTAPPLVAGPLQVGLGFARMPAPVGIGTTGNNGLGVTAEPSPFAEMFPATTGYHMHPDFKAIAISRGEGFEVVLLRSDTVGIVQQLRRAVVLEVMERTGRDLDHGLIIGATHTHSGPGRLIDGGGPYDIISDRFHPEHYERMVDGMADAVVQALDDLKPGRIGTTTTRADDAIRDRRCEDGLEYVNGDLPIIAIEQEGQLTGLHIAYPIHGTVLGIRDLMLSKDVSGGIEHGIEMRFDHPVQVQMFNSWGADMAPGDPPVATRDGASQFDGFDKIERIGISVADAVEAAMDDLVWTDTPEIVTHTWRVPIDREAIGYAPGEFPYDYGAVFCSGGEECQCPSDPNATNVCTGTEVIAGLDTSCIPFPPDFPGPDQTELSSGQIGDLHFLTFPGEPGTLLSEQMMDAIRAEHDGVEHLAVFGYSQDHLGYSILEDDWWNGGYEASGTLWGPRQGEYLAERSVAAYGWTYGNSPDAEPEIIEAFDTAGYAVYAPTAGIDAGTVLVDVAETTVPTDVLTFEVAGLDPWLGAPLATLMNADGTPVTAANGTPITSDGVGFMVTLQPDPGYADAPNATSRTFRWRFEFPVQHRQDIGFPILNGDYRFDVALPDGTNASTRTFTASTP